MKAKLGPQDIGCFPPALFIWLRANMDMGQSKNTHHLQSFSSYESRQTQISH
jgi:hypothetical protein